MPGTAKVVSGLACVPTSPASLQVSVDPGEMYTPATLDATSLNCPVPATSGQSVNYLTQVTYLDIDAGLVALPYCSASSPSQAWLGPNNTGTQQATVRKGIVNISAKPGVAATTGS